jgi:type IV fimbrial biogenesis protein FimT
MYRPTGFTLIELLVTLLLLTIAATLGVPAFSNLLLEMRMTTQVNRLVRAVHLAKQAAHMTLSQTALCKSADGRQCGNTPHWHDGWIVFVNRDADYPPRVDPGERVLDVGDPYPSGTIAGNRLNFVFRPFATRSTNGTLTFCDRRGVTRSRAIVISYTGRPRVTHSDALAECPL